jgi:hypothetical protein
MLSLITERAPVTPWSTDRSVRFLQLPHDTRFRNPEAEAYRSAGRAVPPPPFFAKSESLPGFTWNTQIDPSTDDLPPFMPQRGPARAAALGPTFFPSAQLHNRPAAPSPEWHRMRDADAVPMG